ncbi:MAG TPA: hypothetical protein VF327_05260 [Gaiellaceae bacterium]
MALPISLGALRGLAKEVQASARDSKPLAVGGVRELATVLRRELGKDAKLGGIREGDDPRGAAVFVYILGREPTKDNEQALKRARRARVPIVAVAAGRLPDDVSIPFVLATDIVRVGAGEGFPIEAIARVIASRLGEDGAPLAARLPVLRGPVCDGLVASFARRSGVLGAAVFVPGADLPVLALNQIRMILRLEQAYGLDADPRERAPELLATVAAGFGLRAVARQLLAVVPVAGWAVKGAVAYAGTRALGEAAVKRLEIPIPGSAAPGGHGAGLSTRPPAGASSGAP